MKDIWANISMLHSWDYWGANWKQIENFVVFNFYMQPSYHKIEYKYLDA